VPSSPTTYTAYFTTQYYLTTAVSPYGAGTISPASGWYNSGSVVQVNAYANGGYQFSSFTGSVDSGSNPLYVTMNGAMTETANFTQVTLPAVTLLSPSNGATAQSVTPTLSWTSSSGATSYDLYLGTSSSPPFYANTGNTTYTPTLSGATQYWWKVVAKNSGGSSPNSAMWSFTTAALPSITSLSPYSGLVSSAVMISGNNFGSSHGASTVTFNGTPAQVTSWSSTGIWVTVPNGATSGNVVVTAGGSASNGVGFNVTVTPLGTSSYLHVNLGYVPFSQYDTSHLATAFSSWGCPPNSSVRGCFRNILDIMHAQHVSGVRIFVTFCDPSSQAFTNGQNPPFCDPTQGPITAHINTGDTWITNVGNFFSDVQEKGIPNVTITTNPSGPSYPVPKEQTASSATPQGRSCADPDGNCCSDTHDLVYFNPAIPFGLQSSGDPIGSTQNTNSNEGYNCAPINSQYFLGWGNLFNVINAMLAAAQGKVTINELEFMQQEMDLVNFPAFYRYIYDTYPGHATPPQTTTDVLVQLRQLMTNNYFEPGRVTWSAPYNNSQQDPTSNCTNAYTDWARNTTLDALAAGIGGGYLGLAPGVDLGVGDGLPCGGNFSGPYQAPYYHTQPSIVDAHIYPQLQGYGPDQNQATPDQSQAVIQQVANLNYTDLTHLFAIVPGLQSAQVIIGETFSGTMYQGNYQVCLRAPTSAPAGNVLGFNQSALASYPVVFRPWMNLEDTSDACYAYGQVRIAPIPTRTTGRTSRISTSTGKDPTCPRASKRNHEVLKGGVVSLRSDGRPMRPGADRGRGRNFAGLGKRYPGPVACRRAGAVPARRSDGASWPSDRAHAGRGLD